MSWASRGNFLTFQLINLSTHKSDFLTFQLLNFSTRQLSTKRYRNVSSKVPSNVRTGSGVSTDSPLWLSRHDSVAESAVL